MTDMNNKPRTNEHKPLYAGIMAIAVAVTVSSGIFLYMNTLGASAPPEYITLSEKNKISFRAQLTDAKPFGRLYLDQTSDHIPMSILDYIDLTTNYKAEFSSITSVNFYDSSTITVIATQDKGSTGAENSPIILNRTFPLCLDNKDMTNPEACPDGSGQASPQGINDKSYLFTNTHRLYLQPYIDFITSTTKTYADYPIKASATIDFQMSVSNGQLHSLMKRVVTIPLTEDNFQVTITGEENQSKDFYAPERTIREIITLIVFGILTISGIGVAMLMIKKLLNKKSPYRQEVDGYLSSYADAIVKTTTPPDLKEHSEHITVESFKEMLNLAVSTSSPIICFGTAASTIFYIVHETVFYYYIVNDPDFWQRRRNPLSTRTRKNDPVWPGSHSVLASRPNTVETNHSINVRMEQDDNATDDTVIDTAPTNHSKPSAKKLSIRTLGQKSKKP